MTKSCLAIKPDFYRPWWLINKTIWIMAGWLADFFVLPWAVHKGKTRLSDKKKVQLKWHVNLDQAYNNQHQMIRANCGVSLIWVSLNHSGNFGFAGKPTGFFARRPGDKVTGSGCSNDNNSRFRERSCPQRSAAILSTKRYEVAS